MRIWACCSVLQAILSWECRDRFEDQFPLLAFIVRPATVFERSSKEDGERKHGEDSGRFAGVFRWSLFGPLKPSKSRRRNTTHVHTIQGQPLDLIAFLPTNIACGFAPRGENVVFSSSPPVAAT